MSHTYTRNYVYLIFSTKERARTIAKEVQLKLWAYMAGICHHHKMVSTAIGGIDDHVHLLFHLPPTLPLSKAVYLVKANSSGWMKDYVQDFDWQQGYAAFSVNASNLAPVEKYIRNQGSYHKKITFQQEFPAFLKNITSSSIPDMCLAECRPSPPRDARNTKPARVEDPGSGSRMGWGLFVSQRCTLGYIGPRLRR